LYDIGSVCTDVQAEESSLVVEAVVTVVDFFNGVVDGLAGERVVTVVGCSNGVVDGLAGEGVGDSVLDAELVSGL
jgi:hypothetical protein